MATDRDFRVLVATDGSAPAKTAVATAVRFPWPARTRAHGVTARQVPADYRRSILLAALDRSAEVIASGARRALARRWPETDVRIVDTTPVAGVLDEAKRVDADVIVVGWRGHGAARRFLMGSVSRGVVRGAKCAVLVVRRGQRDVRRIVIGFDGSVNAQRAVDFVGRLPPPRGGQIIVFRAVDHIGVPSHALAPAESARQSLRRLNESTLSVPHGRKRTSHGLKLPSRAPAGASEPQLPQARRCTIYWPPWTRRAPIFSSWGRAAPVASATSWWAASPRVL